MRPAGFEPTTPWFEAKYSNPLSYGRISRVIITDGGQNVVYFGAMKQVIFATSNNEKLLTAQHTCARYDIEILQKKLDIVEIQSEDPAKVAIDKAQKAFAIVGQPVVVTDDAWAIPGLGGFPGVYMHSVNEWFTAEDFLRLILPLQDRRIVLTQNAVYCDATGHKIFTQQTEGKLLTEIRGSSKYPSFTITTMPGDVGQSVAEVYANISDKSGRESAAVWHDFAVWCQTL